MTASADDRRRALWTAAQLVLGGGLTWAAFGSNYGVFVTLGLLGPAGFCGLVGCAAVLAFAPATGRPVARAITHWQSLPSPRVRRIGSAVAAGVTFVYLLVTALGQHRNNWPYVHDEFSYLIQAHQFAAGHLWYHSHPLADFFDSFQLFVRPVYASAYFPGTALLYVPGVWLHVPPWVTSLALAAAVAGLLYRVVAEAVDGLWAALAVLLLWCVNPYRAASMMTLGQLPLMLYGLLAVVAWLNWRADRRGRRLIGIGLWLGLAAVTRPVDAICFAVPVGVAVIAEVGRSRRTLLRAAALVGVGLLPSVALQSTLDRGVTGQWLRTPFGLYADAEYPGTAYGFHPPPPDARPASPLPQKQLLYDQYKGLIRLHTPANVWPAIVSGFKDEAGFSPPRLGSTLSLMSPQPFPLLVPLMPLAVLGLTRPRAVLLSAGPLFLALYAGYVFFFPHYTLAAAVAVLTAVAAGGRALARLPVPAPVAYAVPVLVTVVLFGLAVGALPQWDESATDDLVKNEVVGIARKVEADLAPLGPAVVLFTYDPARSPHDEPVFNADVGWPDDAQVVRAHDLGPERDRELFQYYAKYQPGRVIYRFDERSRKLSRLGTATTLAGGT